MDAEEKARRVAEADGMREALRLMRLWWKNYQRMENPLMLRDTERWIEGRFNELEAFAVAVEDGGITPVQRTVLPALTTTPEESVQRAWHDKRMAFLEGLRARCRAAGLSYLVIGQKLNKPESTIRQAMTNPNKGVPVYLQRYLQERGVWDEPGEEGKMPAQV